MARAQTNERVDEHAITSTLNEGANWERASTCRSEGGLGAQGLPLSRSPVPPIHIAFAWEREIANWIFYLWSFLFRREENCPRHHPNTQVANRRAFMSQPVVPKEVHTLSRQLLTHRLVRCQPLPESLRRLHAAWLVVTYRASDWQAAQQASGSTAPQERDIDKWVMSQTRTRTQTGAHALRSPQLPRVDAAAIR